jgi:hypothetical protein
MATVLNEVAAMIATEVSRLIRMSSSPRDCDSIIRDGKQLEMTTSRREDRSAANCGVDATPMRCEGSRDMPGGNQSSRLSIIPSEIIRWNDCQTEHTFIGHTRSPLIVVKPEKGFRDGRSLATAACARQ